MRALSIFIFFISSVSSSHQQQGEQKSLYKQKLKNNMEECMQRLNVDALQELFAPDGEITNKLFQCLIKCIFVKLGIMDEAGEVDLSEIKRQLSIFVDESTATEAIDKCRDQKGVDPCETAYKLSTCYRDIFVNIMRT